MRYSISALAIGIMAASQTFASSIGGSGDGPMVQGNEVYFMQRGTQTRTSIIQEGNANQIGVNASTGGYQDGVSVGRLPEHATYGPLNLILLQKGDNNRIGDGVLAMEYDDVAEFVNGLPRNRIAGLVQTGRNLQANVEQIGNNNEVETLIQLGQRNFMNIRQFGHGNELTADQRGRDNDMLLNGHWAAGYENTKNPFDYQNNIARLNQFESVSNSNNQLEIEGSGNSARQTQVGITQFSTILGKQFGDNNEANVHQQHAEHSNIVYQQHHGHLITSVVQRAQSSNIRITQADGLGLVDSSTDRNVIGAVRQERNPFASGTPGNTTNSAITIQQYGSNYIGTAAQYSTQGSSMQIQQNGHGNNAGAAQSTYSGMAMLLTQTGTDNSVTANQTSIVGHLIVRQYGHANIARVTQMGHGTRFSLEQTSGGLGVYDQ